jgi:hypothetical protein
MIFTLDLDNPEEVLNFAVMPLRMIHDAFDDGVSYADTQLEGQPQDSHYWSHSARYRARNVLNEVTWQEGWHLGRDLANSGVEIVRGDLTMRVLKAIGGAPPHPGHNRARQSFWRQKPAVVVPTPQQLYFALAIDGLTLLNGSNLIVDWDVIAKRQLVLALSKPDGVWNYQKKPRLAWRRHVIFGDANEPRFDPTEEDIPVEYPDYDVTELDEPEEY